MKRYKSYFNEAIIIPKLYIENIESKIDIIYKKKVYNKKLKPIQIARVLSEVFVKDKIFIFYQKSQNLPNFNDNSNYYGIEEGETLDNKSRKIYIYINERASLVNEDMDFFNQFKQYLIINIKHELIHRMQKIKALPFKLESKIYNLNNKDDVIRYLLNPQEVMARAWDIIEEMKVRGYTGNEIKGLLRNFKKFADINFTARLYYRYILSEDLKLLYKYLYLYLEERYDKTI